MSLENRLTKLEQRAAAKSRKPQDWIIIVEHPPKGATEEELDAWEAECQRQAAETPGVILLDM